MSSWSWAFWVLAALLGAGALVMLYRGLLHDRARGRLRCPLCWFDMGGAPGLVCPECGTSAGTAARLGKTRRHYGAMVIAVVLGLASFVNSRVPAVLASGDWTAGIPGPVMRASAPFFNDRGDSLLTTTPNAQSLNRFDRMLLARACARSMLECARANGGRDPRTNPKFAMAQQSLLGLGEDAELVLPTLMDMLRSPSEGEWKGAVSVIGTIGHSVPATLPAIGEVLKEPDAEVRLRCLTALESFSNSDPATELMVARFADPDERVRRRAALVFDRAGRDPWGKHLQAVIASIKSETLSTEEEGVRALAGYGPRGLPAMIELITHPSVGVRRAVVGNFGGYGRVDDPPPGVIDALRTALADQNAAVRYDAVRALGGWGGRPRAAAPMVLALCDASNRDVLVRCGALEATARIGGEGALLVLMHALEDGDVAVRRCAARGLGRLGEGATAAQEALAAHCEDPDGDVRAEASQALLEVRR